MTILNYYSIMVHHLTTPTVRYSAVLGGTATICLLSDGLRIITRSLFVQNSMYINRKINPYVILYIKQYKVVVEVMVGFANLNQ